VSGVSSAAKGLRGERHGLQRRPSVTPVYRVRGRARRPGRLFLGAAAGGAPLPGLVRTNVRLQRGWQRPKVAICDGTFGKAGSDWTPPDLPSVEAAATKGGGFPAASPSPVVSHEVTGLAAARRREPRTTGGGRLCLSSLRAGPHRARACRSLRRSHAARAFRPAIRDWREYWRERRLDRLNEPNAARLLIRASEVRVLPGASRLWSRNPLAMLDSVTPHRPSFIPRYPAKSRRWGRHSRGRLARAGPLSVDTFEAIRRLSGTEACPCCLLPRSRRTRG
jgi:hypothetical protein